MKSSTPPAPGITRSRTEPVTAQVNNGGKAIVGTLIGAAAGAAFAYAVCQSERESARDEVAFAASASARSKAPSLKGNRTRSNYEGSTVTRKSHRSSQHPGSRARAIEAPSYHDYYAFQDAISRHKPSQRPEPQRSRTYDAIEYAPRSNATGRSDRFSMKRSSTFPDQVPQYLLEGPKTAPASKHTSRRGSVDDSNLKRHDSGVSMNSHRSRRSFDGERRSSASKASTAKPSRRGSLYQSAAGVPLPPSKAQSYISAADMPLPASQAASYYSAAQVPIPPSTTARGYTELGEESDGLGDMATVVPEDSISCVDFSPKPKKSKLGSSKSSRHSSKPSEASTVKPSKHNGSKHSAQTLPMRPKDEYYSNSKGGKRTIISYA